MKTRENTKKKPNANQGIDKGNNHFLILHNDDVNSFDYVIETLIEVCQHNSEQAEQCAMVTHYKGKCDIKKGSYDILAPVKEKLIDRGLTASID